jgi:phosphatidylserine/phosphatidylglycerophosphate/cardiolipin synthase-like enzyme
MAALATLRGPAARQDGISVYFSPDGGCTQAVIDRVKRARDTIRVQAARDTIRVQAYYFSSAPIAEALMRAHQRGVDVQVLLDSSQRTQQYSSATFFHNQNIPVFIDSRHAIAHDKIILIDGATVITGSFNFTKSAEERNVENLLIIDGKQRLANAYDAHFEEHLRHAEPYEGLRRDTSAGASAPVVAPAVRSGDKSADTVYVTRSGRKYHDGTCRHLSKSKVPMTLADAKRRYAPCLTCRPPE